MDANKVPTEPMSIERVPIDPDVMVEYVRGALCGCAVAVSEGLRAIQSDMERDVQG